MIHDKIIQQHRMHPGALHSLIRFITVIIINRHIPYSLIPHVHVYGQSHYLVHTCSMVATFNLELESEKKGNKSPAHFVNHFKLNQQCLWDNHGDHNSNGNKLIYNHHNCKDGITEKGTFVHTHTNTIDTILSPGRQSKKRVRVQLNVKKENFSSFKSLFSIKLKKMLL